MQETLAWMYGTYTAHAVATIGKHKFPDKPIHFFDFTKNEEQNRELTEEEKRMYREKLVASLMIMQNNAKHSDSN